MAKGKKISLPGGKTFQLPVEGAGGNQDLFLQALLGFCDNNETRGVVEFDCGDCCKFLFNVANVAVFAHAGANTILTFIPPRNESLVLKIFSDGKLVDKQLATEAFIPLFRICSFGCVDVNNDPCDVCDSCDDHDVCDGFCPNYPY